MSRTHRVRTHRWRNGRLEVKDRIFGTLYEALAFANSVENADSIKVFDHEDQITHDILATTADTYA